MLIHLLPSWEVFRKMFYYIVSKLQKVLMICLLLGFAEQVMFANPNFENWRDMQRRLENRQNLHRLVDQINPDPETIAFVFWIIMLRMHLPRPVVEPID